MKQTLLAVLVSVCSAVPAFAYIPPVGGILREVFDSRKISPPLEVLLRHRISVGGGEVTEVEERIAAGNGETLFLWRGGGQTGAGLWQKGNYVCGGGKTFPLRSAAFVKSFTAASDEEYKEILLSEGWIRRDQLQQFRPGYSPKGDPDQWNLSENYLRHPDIYLTRVKSGVAFAIAGTDAGEKRRAILIDRSMRGLRRLEGKDGGETYAWDFDSLGSTAAGIFPRKLSFELGTTEMVASEVVHVKPISSRQLSDFKTTVREAMANAPSGSLEASLRVLLSHR